ncbi:hypothetical protein RHGRI_031275 [Rhododendron griersonianum]|uniref:Uncharacterized protein n=1 Tax=Rhododendron griersonianum TaxID=479676 RepID=A0AAV6ID29_9ERIC|nr:hypothetical protein RHGRI_031275 [Rhododendron griersonianum]
MYGSLSFKPLPDQAYWPSYDGPRILPDKERLRGRGRPKVNRIRNEMDDLIEHQPPQACSKCGQQEADVEVELNQLGDAILPGSPVLEELLHDVPGSVGILGCPLLLL